MKLERLAELNRSLREQSRRTRKIKEMASVIAALQPNEIECGVTFLCGEVRQTRLGVGQATVSSLRASPACTASLTLTDVDQTLERVAKTSGRGSKATRERLLVELFARATENEQSFLRGLLLSELRQGALEGLVVQAVAQAAGVASEGLLRAIMFSGRLHEVAVAALSEGEAGLCRFRLELFRPIRPMLAQPSEDGWAEAFATNDALVEYKVDGARVQIHREGPRVEVYSRKLNVVTDRVPELVEFALALPCRSVVLDGEAVALRQDGSPLPFQNTMERFGRTLNVNEARRRLPLVPILFDCLHLDGRALHDETLDVRRKSLEELVGPAERVLQSRISSPEGARAFFDRALARGHEGIMVKRPQSLYQAGKRGGDWVKVKRTHSLDLVVIAAEWGSGRRQGKLSNLHLAARGEAADSFVMLGKTFKGMTDAVLTWQTHELLARQIERKGHVVVVRPELVVEVAFDGLQRSPQYPAGVALRFARIRGYRSDKSAMDADTIGSVLALFEADLKRGADDNPAPLEGREAP